MESESLTSETPRPMCLSHSSIHGHSLSKVCIEFNLLCCVLESCDEELEKFPLQLQFPATSVFVSSLNTYS